MLIQLLFYLFGTILVLGALGVIIARNPVYSALALVLCFITSAAIWLLVEAEFLAVVLVLVYVGAVMVLFLFVVMMLDIDLEELRRGFTRFAWLGWLTALAVIVEIVGVVWAHGAGGLGVDASHGGTPTAADYSNTLALGSILYTRYAYPLELAAMLLLVAIVAAIALTMRHRSGYKQQDINAQVAVKAADRVRLVKMPAEKRP
jgi:NADH-quinone oxidoreductase subunit J